MRHRWPEEPVGLLWILVNEDILGGGGSDAVVPYLLIPDFFGLSTGLFVLSEWGGRIKLVIKETLVVVGPSDATKLDPRELFLKILTSQGIYNVNGGPVWACSHYLIGQVPTIGTPYLLAEGGRAIFWELVWIQEYLGPIKDVIRVEVVAALLLNLVYDILVAKTTVIGEIVIVAMFIN